MLVVTLPTPVPVATTSAAQELAATDVASRGSDPNATAKEQNVVVPPQSIFPEPFAVRSKLTLASEPHCGPIVSVGAADVPGVMQNPSVAETGAAVFRNAPPLPSTILL